MVKRPAPQSTADDRSGDAIADDALNTSQASACRGCPADHDPADEDKAGPDEQSPAWLSENPASAAQRVDVRALLAARREPFVIVMQAANALPPDGILLIDAPFNPRPLRRVLETRAFETYGQRVEAGHWRIWCRRASADPCEHVAAAKGAARGRVWRGGSVVHIDVRGLEAPAPLVAILTLIDGGPHEGVVIVHHHRDPLYLYPELAERGWSWTPLPSPPNEVRLELRRKQ